MGTFPGGLDLPDPGEPAVSRTGLIYSCSITPDSQCDAVRGDEDLFQGVNGNVNLTNNDLLNGAGRFFDHRRMYYTCTCACTCDVFLLHVHV